MVKEMTNFCSC